MASDTQANIILRLKDEFSKNLKDAGKNFQSFAQEVDRVGTAMSRTGMKMVAVGTAMNAPFFAAVKAMENYSFAARNEMVRLNNEFLSLSKVVAEAAMPTIKAFNDNFSRLVNALKTIDPVLLQNIAHWAMVAGQILIVAGTIEIFTGKVLSLLAKMFSPINLIIIAIGLLTYAWIEHHDTVMKVLNAIDIVFNQWVVNSLVGFEAIMKGLAELSKWFPPMAGMYGPLKAGLDSLSSAIAGFRVNIVQAQSGNGAFAQTVNNLGKGIQKFAVDFKKSFQNASKDLDTVMKDMRSRVLDTTNSIADGFGDAFGKALFEGQSFGESMKSLFKSLGQSIVKDFVSTVGRNLFNGLLGGAGQQSGTGIGGLLGAGLGSFFGPIGTAIGGMFGGLFHDGGMIYAHNGLAPDEVPIIAQSGEGVLSRKGMKGLGGSDNLRKLNAGGSVGGGGVTVMINQVIQAWDAQDVYRNRKVLSAALAQEIRTNGNLRKVIKDN